MTTHLQPILPARLAKSQVQAVYKSVAPIYDLWGRLTESAARQRCLELAQVQNGETILEVAVGTGLLFSQILSRNPSGWNEGIDMTPEMLAKAHQQAIATGLTNYRLRQGDAYHLDFPENRFDVVINNYMFDLLPEEDFLVVLAEFKRVLKPGGRLVLANMTKAERWHHNFWENVYRLNPGLLGGCRGVRLSESLHKLGFQQTQREYISQLGFPSEIILAMA
jgi:ubiquinone/menaquinone biosynthesis C-methylase UbiE